MEIKLWKTGNIGIFVYDAFNEDFLKELMRRIDSELHQIKRVPKHLYHYKREDNFFVFTTHSIHRDLYYNLMRIIDDLILDFNIQMTRNETIESKVFNCHWK